MGVRQELPTQLRDGVVQRPLDPHIPEAFYFMGTQGPLSTISYMTTRTVSILLTIISPVPEI